MFEQFDESSRRCIFWARYAANIEGGKEITVLHLLAGVRREAQWLFRETNLEKAKIKLTVVSDQAIEKLSAARRLAVEIPLGAGAKKALTSAAQISQKMEGSSVTPAHLLAGILHADSALRKKMQKAGLTEKELKKRLKAPSAKTSETTKPRVTRCGLGYDLHRLAEKRKLILGGVEVPFEKGPVGHSDGDVLSHAICDALLGASGMGDIGTHFPDSDPQWRGVSSLVFLRQVRQYLERRRWRIAHVDAVVITERPRLGPHFAAMRDTLAKALRISPHQINLKAKTNEGVDAIGRGEAIAAQALATIEN
ncbi:MAG: 2-C-methyl-D-erythritol 2,4-cyclodiphosphate synthase [Candidatus Acidiferrales bacterium]